MTKLIDLTGKTYTRLTVIERAENREQFIRWLCQCSCGNKTVVDGHNLRSGTVKSCGCMRKEMQRNFGIWH